MASVLQEVSIISYYSLNYDGEDNDDDDDENFIFKGFHLLSQRYSNNAIKLETYPSILYKMRNTFILQIYTKFTVKYKDIKISE